MELEAEGEIERERGSVGTVEGAAAVEHIHKQSDYHMVKQI